MLDALEQETSYIRETLKPSICLEIGYLPTFPSLLSPKTRQWMRYHRSWNAAEREIN